MNIEKKDRSRKRWLGLSRAARRAGVDPSTLHRAAKRGEVVFVETAVGRLFLDRDVDRWSSWRESKREAAA